MMIHQICCNKWILKRLQNYATHLELQNSLWSSLSWSVKEILKHSLTNLQETKDTRTVKTNSFYYYYILNGGENGVSLTGVHVRSVRQRLGLPPKTHGFLLLLLQDEAAQVGLDLDAKHREFLSVHFCESLFFSSNTNLFQLLLLQRLGLFCQVFKLILLLQPLLPPLDLCKNSTT